MMQYLLDILPNSIFNWKTTFRFQKLNLFSLDIQSRKQQLIVRQLKQRNAYFFDNTWCCGSFPQGQAPSCKTCFLPWQHIVLHGDGHSEVGLHSVL